MTDPRLSRSFDIRTVRQVWEAPVGQVEYFSLHAVPGSDELSYSHKILLENLLRHLDTRGGDAAAVTVADVEALVSGSLRPHAIGFHPSRAFLHDTNGVPVLTDLAAMRDAAQAAGHDPSVIDSVIPAHLTVDHSVVTDYFARPDAPALNVAREYERNAERYRFLKWGKETFAGLEVVPPGAGIMHQVNVEYLADVITVRAGRAFPDTVAGTDSHTTMVNGLSVLAWGVGGIEAEAAMLGEPISMLIPPVVGVELVGELSPGVTATDLVLTITERMRAVGVVGKFVEFYGTGVSTTSIATRCTIANMSPEFGSTAAMFPIDQLTIDYLRFTGRDEAHVATVEAYARMQGLWHDPRHRPRFAETVRIELAEVVPSLAGPRRPQDRVNLDRAPAAARRHVDAILATREKPAPAAPEGAPQHAAIAIASITSCTNTSNPAVMMAAGLLARNAVRRGLQAKPWVKTSLAPGSRVVTDYLERAGLTPYLDTLGFGLVGYGCMTCIGNSGSLLPDLATAIADDGLIVASVLSGNRNFDGRINNDVSMNFLASPPLVVAYAIAGSMDVDLTREPLGHDADGDPVFLSDVWPSDREIDRAVATSIEPQMYREVYSTIFDGDENWQALDAPRGARFAWDPDSTYLRRPPFLDRPAPMRDTVDDIEDMRVLEFVGDSVTTDHICPAGRIPEKSAAGRHLEERGLPTRDLNSYASRRGNWEVMRLGGFANPRLENRLVPQGTTASSRYLGPQGMCIDEVHAVADRYAGDGTPLLVLAGKEYGTGSSRDWAAKVTALLGVRVVLAESYERIHRSNLVGMGVLPLQYKAGQGADSIGLDGTESFSLVGLQGRARVPDSLTIHVRPVDGRPPFTFAVDVRLDTLREHTYYRHGGLLPFVLQQVLDETTKHPDAGALR